MTISWKIALTVSKLTVTARAIQPGYEQGLT
jgi:hypothetical protein